MFTENCSGCHGVTGHRASGGPDLSAIPSAANMQRVIEQVTNGGDGMLPFKGILGDQQIRDVAAYVTMRVAK